MKKREGLSRLSFFGDSSQRMSKFWYKDSIKELSMSISNPVVINTAENYDVLHTNDIRVINSVIYTLLGTTRFTVTSITNSRLPSDGGIVRSVTCRYTDTQTTYRVRACRFEISDLTLLSLIGSEEEYIAGRVARDIRHNVMGDDPPNISNGISFRDFTVDNLSMPVTPVTPETVWSSTIGGTLPHLNEYGATSGRSTSSEDAYLTLASLTRAPRSNIGNQFVKTSTSVGQTSDATIDSIIHALKDRISVNTTLDFDGEELSSTTTVTLILTDGTRLDTEFTGDTINISEDLTDA